MRKSNLLPTACLNIQNRYSHKETADIVGRCLGIEMEFDESGRWEEFPAYIGLTLGMEFALLAPPDPEFDLREVQEDVYQLTIRNHFAIERDAKNVDISSLLVALISSNSNLECELIGLT